MLIWTNKYTRLKPERIATKFHLINLKLPRRQITYMFIGIQKYYHYCILKINYSITYNN